MKRTVCIIALALILAVLVFLAVFVLRHLDVFKPLLHSVRYSQSEIETQLEDSRRKVQEVTEKHPEITVRDLTEEEKQALREQTLTQEEAIALITGKKTEEPPASEPAEPAQTTEPVPAEPAQTQESVPTEPSITQQQLYEQQLSELIAETYLMREEFTQKLDEIEARAKEAYHSLPEEKKTKKELVNFATGYIAEASALEEECNDRMDIIVFKMNQLITENNGDPAILDAVIEAYIQEKSLKKALYFTELQKRGWIQK